MPPVPGHGQFLDQISVKTYVGTPSFYCEMCPIKLGHAQFQKRDYPPGTIRLTIHCVIFEGAVREKIVPKICEWH